MIRKLILVIALMATVIAASFAQIKVDQIIGFKDSIEACLDAQASDILITQLDLSDTTSCHEVAITVLGDTYRDTICVDLYQDLDTITYLIQDSILVYNAPLGTEIGRDTIRTGSPTTTEQYYSGDTLYTVINGIEEWQYCETNSDTSIVENIAYKIQTCYASDGGTYVDTTGCDALPPIYMISEVGEVFIDSTCMQRYHDITSNDMLCPGGFYIVDSITLTTTPESSTAPADIDVLPNGLIQLTIFPGFCTYYIEYNVYTRYVCGTDTSNQAKDVVIHLPPPIGDARIAKVNDAESNTVDSGDVFTYTISVCNVGTGPILNGEVTDQLPSCLTYISSDSGAATGNLYEWTLPSPWPADTCYATDVVVQVDCIGFESITNVARVTGGDGQGGETSDLDIDIVNENQVAEARVMWSDPDPNTGFVTASFEFIKAPSGALIGCGVNYEWPYYLEDGTLWETITGHTCSTDYVSDRTDGLSVLDFSPSGDIGNGLNFQWNKRDWAVATGHVYAATGASNKNGNTPITATESLSDRTFAQELRTDIFIGGIDPATGKPHPDCPIISANPDNSSEICKIIGAFTSAQLIGTSSNGNACGNGLDWMVANMDNFVNTSDYLGIDNTTTVNDITIDGTVNPFTEINFSCNNRYWKSYVDLSNTENCDYHEYDYEVLKINGLKATGRWSYLSEQNSTGTGSGYIQFFTRVASVSHTSGCNSFDVTHVLQRRTADLADGQNCGSIDYNLVVTSLDEDFTVINGNTFSHSFNFANSNPQTVTINHTYPGVGIYAESASFISSDGPGFESFQEWQTELNFIW